MTRGENRMIEELYGLTDGLLEYDQHLSSKGRRRGPGVDLPPPPFGDVTVRRADGTCEIRPMNRAELVNAARAKG